MNLERPLEQVSSIKVKLALLVGLSVVAAALVVAIGREAGVPLWLSLPVTVAGALGVTQWLARGMTAPLREMTAAARRLATGDYGAVVTTTGSDEVGELARSFTTMAGELAAVDRQRRQLVAMVSHELRTPLAAQRAVLENLVDGIVPPGEDVLRGALRQSERLSVLVEDLLDLSRVDGGQTALRLEEVDVATLLAESVAEIGLQGRPVEVLVRVEPPELTVRADRARLAQVVANLLDNASRMSPAGGRIEVAAGAGPHDWTLEVHDQGPGLDPGSADRLFRRFGAGDDHGGGTGLGLAIAGWVCQLHAGTITALPTRPGEGARIRATLPRHPPVPAAVHRTHTPSELTPPASSTQLQEPPVPTRPPSPTTPQDGRTPPAKKPGTSSGQQSSLIDGLFGELWPERVSRAQPAYVWGSFAVGLVGATILPDRNLGLGVLLVLVLAGGLVLRASPTRRSRWTNVHAVLCVALGTLVVWRDDVVVAFLAVAAAGALTVTALTGARTVPGMVVSGLAWIGAALRGLPLLTTTLRSLSRHRLLWPVARTSVVSVLALVLFGGLFASADAVLGAWAGDLLPDLAWDSLVFRVFVFVFVAGIVLAGCYLALNPPVVSRPGRRAARPSTAAWEWQVPLGLVIATFAVFLLAQGAAMFGGHDYLRRTTGLTYAEYVHQGFGQLCVSTALTLVVVALVRRRAVTSWAVTSSAAAPRDHRALTVGTVVLCVLTLGVVASALHRMDLYQQAYGYTTLRLFVDGVELWLGVLVAFQVVAALRGRTGWLPRAALLSGAVFVLGYGALNPQGWVAQTNIARYHETGRLDPAYLSSLGADATSAIVSGGLPADLTTCILDRRNAGSPDDVLGWNLARSRSADLVATRGSTGAATPTSAACAAILSALESASDQ